jgi:hypothetical protein
MLLLPPLCLLAGTTLVGLFRRSREFYLWVIVFGSVFLSWLAILLGSGGAAGALGLSVWRPEALFSAALNLQLRPAQQEVVFAAVTVLLVVVLTAPARGGAVGAAEWAVMLTYALFALLGMMAGNLLTLGLLLILLDIGAFVLILQQAGGGSGSRQAVVRLGVDSIGVLLILTAGLLATVEAAGGDLTSGQAAALDAMLIFGAALRLGILPLPLGLPPEAAARRSIGTLMRLYPPAIILVQLSSQVDGGVATPLRPWLIVFGVVAIALAGIQWAFHGRSLDARAYLVAATAGLALLIGGGVEQQRETALIAAGVLVLLTGASVSVAAVHTPFHRLWPAAAALAVVGLPLTPGGVLLQAVAGEGVAFALAMAAGAALGLMTTGVAWMIRMPQAPWLRAEGYARLLFGFGLALCPLAALGFGIRQGVQVHPAAVLGLGVSMAVAGVGTALRRRLPGGTMVRARRLVSWLDIAAALGALWAAYGWLLGLARSIGYALEGEGAFLWVIGLIAFVAALVVGGGG